MIGGLLDIAGFGWTKPTRVVVAEVDRPWVPLEPGTPKPAHWDLVLYDPDEGATLTFPCEAGRLAFDAMVDLGNPEADGRCARLGVVEAVRSFAESGFLDVRVAEPMRGLQMVGEAHVIDGRERWCEPVAQWLDNARWLYAANALVEAHRNNDEETAEAVIRSLPPVKFWGSPTRPNANVATMVLASAEEDHLALNVADGDWTHEGLALAHAIANRRVAGQVSPAVALEYQAGEDAFRSEFTMQPRCLLAAMWFQFMATLDPRAIVLVCDYCGGRDLVLPGSGIRTNRRYCSTKCRVEASQKRRALAMHADGRDAVDIAREVAASIALVRDWTGTREGDHA